MISKDDFKRMIFKDDLKKMTLKRQSPKQEF